MQAALGIEQIKRLDGFLKRRRENYEILSAGLRDVDGLKQLQSSHDEYESSFYCLSAVLEKHLLEKRIDIVEYLRENGIGTSVYYPRPEPHFTYYKNKYQYDEGSFPVAAWISKGSISLPVGPHLDGEDMEYIVEHVKEGIRKVR